VHATLAIVCCTPCATACTFVKLCVALTSLLLTQQHVITNTNSLSLCAHVYPHKHTLYTVQEALEIKKLRDAAALYKALGAKADTLEAHLRSDAVPAAEEGGLAAVAQLKREAEQSLSACSGLELTESMYTLVDTPLTC
jgi:hypothetical protein